MQIHRRPAQVRAAWTLRGALSQALGCTWRARSGELSSCSGSLWPGWLRPCSLHPPPRVRPAALMEVQTFGRGRGCRDCARRFPYRKRAREPIVGPRPPGPPGRSDMAAHRQWAAARHFKGCPAQSAAPPARPLRLYLWGGDPFSLPQRLTLVAPCGSSSGTTAAPQPLFPLPAPSPPHPGPGPPWANVLGPQVCSLGFPSDPFFLEKRR